MTRREVFSLADAAADAENKRWHLPNNEECEVKG